MNKEELKDMSTRVYRGVDMVMSKAEHIGKTKSTYSIDELGQMSDITKDCAQALCYLTKAHFYNEERPQESF